MPFCMRGIILHARRANLHARAAISGVLHAILHASLLLHCWGCDHDSWFVVLARSLRSLRSDHGEGAWGMLSSCGLLSQRALVSDQEFS